ncbi:MAG TPA: DNA polymerase III subunit delta [Candidatus Saccharimonadales bacterium]
MTYLFLGDNAYAKQQAANKLIAAARIKPSMPTIEHYDGETLEPKQLGAILQGASLFSAEKLVVIRDVSKNKALWVECERWVEHVPEGTDVLLIETAVDQRTKTFKLLKKHASITDYRQLNEAEAAKWLQNEAKARRGVLNPKQAEHIIARAGTDQWRLSNELDKLLAHGLDDTAIEALVELTPHANVFALLDAVLHKERQQVEQQLWLARTTEDPYMLFGLLSAQLLQLAALVHGSKGRSSDEIAKALATHPFPLKKLAPLARRTSPLELKNIIDATAELDTQLKSTGLDPWLLLEQTLLKIATRA